MFNFIIADIKKTVIESNEQKLIIKIDILAKTESDLYSNQITYWSSIIKIPQVNIQYSQKDIIPFES